MRWRNLAVAVLLLLVIALVYGVTVVRLGASLRSGAVRSGAVATDSQTKAHNSAINNAD